MTHCCDTLEHTSDRTTLPRAGLFECSSHFASAPSREARTIVRKVYVIEDECQDVFCCCCVDLSSRSNWRETMFAARDTMSRCLAVLDTVLDTVHDTVHDTVSKRINTCMFFVSLHLRVHSSVGLHISSITFRVLRAYHKPINQCGGIFYIARIQIAHHAYNRIHNISQRFQNSTLFCVCWLHDVYVNIAQPKCCMVVTSSCSTQSQSHTHTHTHN